MSVAMTSVNGVPAFPTIPADTRGPPGTGEGGRFGSKCLIVIITWPIGVVVIKGTISNVCFAVGNTFQSPIHKVVASFEWEDVLPFVTNEFGHTIHG